MVEEYWVFIAEDVVVAEVGLVQRAWARVQASGRVDELRRHLVCGRLLHELVVLGNGTVLLALRLLQLVVGDGRGDFLAKLRPHRSQHLGHVHLSERNRPRLARLLRYLVGLIHSSALCNK